MVIEKKRSINSETHAAIKGSPVHLPRTEYSGDGSDLGPVNG